MYNHLGFVDVSIVTSFPDWINVLYSIFDFFRDAKLLSTYTLVTASFSSSGSFKFTIFSLFQSIFSVGCVDPSIFRACKSSPSLSPECVNVSWNPIPL
ncbi:123R [Cherax quadricarinatus iridovirus]|uniref:123R n=1 Tax=Cherax quadricarinatus iridovirus TaxID=2035708 RepID=UPI000BC016C2|nr:123R [Cherax quadricarinatus iridovirus]ASZ85103.1 123R [Cherax quadricarinatus iridovirus]